MNHISVLDPDTVINHMTVSQTLTQLSTTLVSHTQLSTMLVSQTPTQVSTIFHISSSLDTGIYDNRSHIDHNKNVKLDCAGSAWG